MLCKKPFRQGGMQFGCGQCLPCRINRSRLWVHRMLLETQKHAYSSFATLTYDDDHLPEGGTLVPKHTQTWLKRLRENWPDRIRYFLVGEYGTYTSRPHYHAALFGFPPCANPGGTDLRRKVLCDCSQCVVLRRSWPRGHVLLGTLTPESAAYITGYVTKKMTSPDDVRLNGRHPEFARMSLRPGIGAEAVSDLVPLLDDAIGSGQIARLGDVPMSLKHGGKEYPLGRYLRRKLREELGFDTVGGQEAAYKKHHAEMLALLESAGGVKAYVEASELKRVSGVRKMEKRASLFPKLEKL